MVVILEDQLDRIKIKGYKSIKNCDLNLKSLNVLIGCNGAGKSNFISFFRMIQNLLMNNLQVYISKQGGPDTFLHFGRKKTKSINTELFFGQNGYKLELEPTNDNRMMFLNESFYLDQIGYNKIGSGHFETVSSDGAKTENEKNVLQYMKEWKVYHFHDTSDTAYVKQIQDINDNEYLRTDASNLASFLYRLHKTDENSYKKIVNTIRLVAPFFGDLNLRPSVLNNEKIQLEWFEKGSDIPFKASSLSDGTLRFICLVTVLLQPLKLQPSTIIVDEPELGLHPYAIKLLASLMKIASRKKQIIVSTQSVEFLNEFEVDDIIVVDREVNESVLKRLDKDRLKDWLDEYEIGELWRKNILGGRPSR
jgi:predicted ATPase